MTHLCTTTSACSSTVAAARSSAAQPITLLDRSQPIRLDAVPDLAITPEILALLKAGAAVAIGVSGGKDSAAVAIRVIAFLDEIGHTGPRVLVHADLGIMEWRQSLPACQQLAAMLGLELIVVRRAAGDLYARIEQRWANNVRRYTELSCVKLILPWPTAAMRYCTAEGKEAPNASALVKRFPGMTIISVTGIRGQESPKRAKAPIAKLNPRLVSKTRGTTGYTWNPLRDWRDDQVFGYLALMRCPLHEAYTVYGTTRVSCNFCILARKSDLVAAATCEDNHAVYRALVRLEIRSTFSFQDRQWLGDIAPHLLDDQMRADLEHAKIRAAQRQAIESRIPKHLTYTKGWPTAVPSWEEATLLAEVRREVGTIMDLPVKYVTPSEIQGRYAFLLDQANAKAERERAKAQRKADRAKLEAALATIPSSPKRSRRKQPVEEVVQ